MNWKTYGFKRNWKKKKVGNTFDNNIVMNLHKLLDPGAEG